MNSPDRPDFVSASLISPSPRQSPLPSLARSSSDEIDFQAWLVRRDAARQQIRRLSKRELQVVQLVTSGLANKDIAHTLNISVKTIEKHRANASRKLGVNNTAELVRITVLADEDQLDEWQNRSVTVEDENPSADQAANDG